MKKIACVLFAMMMILGFAMAEGNTLIYASGDYTRINPAMDEHGEINIALNSAHSIFFNPVHLRFFLLTS